MRWPCVGKGCATSSTVISMGGTHWTCRLLTTGGQGQTGRQQGTSWKLAVLGELLSLVGWGWGALSHGHVSCGPTHSVDHRYLDTTDSEPGQGWAGQLQGDPLGWQSWPWARNSCSQKDSVQRHPKTRRAPEQTTGPGHRQSKAEQEEIVQGPSQSGIRGQGQASQLELGLRGRCSRRTPGPSDQSWPNKETNMDLISTCSNTNSSFQLPVLALSHLFFFWRFWPLGPLYPWQ